MASGTRETVIDMAGVLAEAGIRENLRQIVAFRAQSIGAIRA